MRKYFVLSSAILVDVANGLRMDGPQARSNGDRPAPLVLRLKRSGKGEGPAKGKQFPSDPLSREMIFGIQQDLGLTGLVKPTSAGDPGMQNPDDSVATDDFPSITSIVPSSELEPYPLEAEFYQQRIAQEMLGITETEKAILMEQHYANQHRITQQQAARKLIKKFKLQIRIQKSLCKILSLS